MKRKKCITSILLTSFSLFLLFYLSGCASTKQGMLDAGMKQMTTQELTSLFSDEKTAKVYIEKKQKWYTVTYLPDGSVSSVRKGKARTSIYYIKNDKFCQKKRFESRKKKCFSWFKIDEKTYHTYGSDGSLSAKLSFQ